MTPRALVLGGLLALAGGCRRTPRDQPVEHSAVPVAKLALPHGKPVLLAAMAGNGRLATGAGALYWLGFSNETAQVLKRIDLAGGPVEQLAKQAFAVTSLAVASDRVYLGGSYDEGLFAVRASGEVAHLVAAGQTNELALDADHIYYLAAHETIARVARGGGASETVYADKVPHQGLQVDADNIYFMRTPATGASQVIRRSKQGGKETTVFELDRSSGLLLHLLMDERSLYWVRTSAEGDELWQAAKAGGLAHVLASQPNRSLAHLCTDGRRVYAIRSDRSRPPFEAEIIAVDSRDGKVTTLVEERARILSDLAVDDRGLYYQIGQGDIMKLAR